jgi:hypothetical protein
MRYFWRRGLVLLLALAVASGSAHAALSLGMTASVAPCADQHDHNRGAALSQGQAAHDHAIHQHKAEEPKAPHGDKGQACCCEGLGCAEAVGLTPPVAFTLAGAGRAVRMDRPVAALSGQSLDPELDPPRPSALT